MNIYVGNMPHEMTENDLRNLFQQFGTVEKASVIKDRDTMRSRGFGFVEMPDKGEAQDAISNLSGKEVNGRPLKINEARPRTSGGGGRQQRNRRW